MTLTAEVKLVAFYKYIRATIGPIFTLCLVIKTRKGSVDADILRRNAACFSFLSFRIFHNRIAIDLDL